MASSSQHKAAIVLEHNGIIAHQTDTIFGLACLPNTLMLTRLSSIKKRPSDKTYILLASSYEQLASYIAIDKQAIDVLNVKTDKPTTWLVKPAQGISHDLIGASQRVAIRITSFSPIKNLCEQVGAIASTSANISNQKVCTQPEQIRKMFGPNIDYVDPNQTPGTGKSSTIIDLSSGKIIRR